MSLREIAKETGLNRCTVTKYLSGEAPVGPPARTADGRQHRRVVDEVAPLIDAMLRSEILLKASVIHERLASEYGVAINYQRVKIYLQEARPRIAEELGIGPGELAGLHRRFEVIPGAQAQVDWGDEGKILAHVGIPKVHSFHMTLSYSRDPFCRFTTSQDLASFFDCHRAAFAHFGGVPMTIVYDRTKTVVRRHVAPGEAVPLHPEAVAFAGHYDFDIDVLAAYRTQGKGRVERQVLIVRDHVLAGRAFSSVEEMNAAFSAWVPLRRAKVHGTHGEIIGHRAVRDHVALRPLPATPYVVAQRHLRHVGKDCLVAFDANLYSVPARKVRPPPAGRDPGHEVTGHTALHRPRHRRGNSPGRPSKGGRPRRPDGGRVALGRPAHRSRTPRHHWRCPAPASPRPASRARGRLAGSPAEPGRCRQRPGRPSPAVGLRRTDRHPPLHH